MTENLDFALKYAAMGWPVVPVNPDKTPYTRHGVKDATTDERILKSWFVNPELMVALAVGFSINIDGKAYRACVIDTDPRNGGNESMLAFEAAHGALPETATSCTAGGGTHQWYLVPEGYRINSRLFGDGLDILDSGKYCIEEGSPGYYWEGEFDPTDGCDMAMAPTHIIEPVEQKQSTTTKINGTGFIPEARVVDLRSALSYIQPDEYETWIKVGQALQSTDAGNQAFGLWDEWSKGSDKYRPGETRKKWSTFRSNGKLNVESIFVWASEAGWVNTAKNKTAQDDDLLALVQEAEKLKHYETVPELPTPIRTLPLKPLQEMAKWMTDQLDTYHPQAVNAAVLTLASALASRKYISYQGEPVHLYMGTLSQSVSSVRNMKGVMQRLLAECGQRKLIRGTRMTSLSSVYRTLERHPVSVYIADDYGQMLNFAKRQPSGVLDQALNAIADIYHGHDIYVDPDIDNIKGTEHTVIYKPCLGMLAMISDDQLALLTKRSEIGRGSLQQMIVVEAGDPEHNNELKTNPVPDSIKTLIADIQKVPNQDQGNLSGLSIGSTPPKTVIIQMTSDAMRVLSEFDKKLAEIKDKDRRLFPLYNGAKKSIRRLLSVLAVWNNPTSPQAGADLALWAGEYILDHFTSFADRYIVSANDSGELDVSQEVLSYIVKAGDEGITQRELVQYCWQYRKLGKDKREELLLDLTGLEDVISLPTKNKQSKRYVAKKFVKEVGSQV